MGKLHAPEVQAAAIADLIGGMTYDKAAAKYRVGKGTLSRWAKKAGVIISNTFPASAERANAGKTAAAKRRQKEFAPVLLTRAERVLAEIENIAFSDPRDVMVWGPNGVVLRDSASLTPEQAKLVCEVSETLSASGSSIKAKLYSKLDALGRLVDILGMKAPTKLDVNVMSDEQVKAEALAIIQEFNTLQPD